MNTANLQQRIIFAVWAIPLGWFLINAPYSIIPQSFAGRMFLEPQLKILPGQVLAILLVHIGFYEYSRMLSIRFIRNGFWLVQAWLLYQFISFFLPDMSLSSTYDIYLLLILVAIEAIVWGKANGRWKRASLLFSGAVFIYIAGYSMLHMYSGPFQAIFAPKFPHAMLSQLGIVVYVSSVFMCDTAAYFAGSLFGRHHFSSISPKKTIEGAVAGLLAATLIFSTGWMFLAGDKYPLVLGPIIGLLLGIFAQSGDLLVSLIKRYFHVKDASDIIPGHGGILDRFDSIFFTAPILSVVSLIIERVLG
ncbi:MAG: hypothetical protein GF398_09465 [Chitinivibrionales bacterium]|nr:hypothetical protein [Chitinivibrionales bacterium]